MKKYQKLALKSGVVSLLSAILGIVMFFVPSIGCVGKDSGTHWDGREWECKLSCYISVFDYIVGNHEAPVRVSGSTESFLEHLYLPVNVVDALEEALEELSEESTSNANDMFYGMPEDIERILKWVGPLAMVAFLCMGIVIVKANKNKGKKVVLHQERAPMNSFYSQNRWFGFLDSFNLIPFISVAFQCYFAAKYSLPYRGRESLSQSARFDLVPCIAFFAIAAALLLISYQLSEKLRKEVATMNDGDMTVFPLYKIQEKTIAEKRVVKENSSIDAIEQLKKYHELYEQGILTEEEFTAKKQELLGGNSRNS